jgi:hypothetical protein
MTIDLSAVVVRRPGVLSAPVDDEIVLFNSERNNYIGLDHVGRAVWELIKTPQRVADVCRLLTDEFDATSAEMSPDVVAFMNQMAEEGIVHVVDD